MLRIEQIRAKGCRGIFDGPILPLGTGGCFLVGDNGSGKSSYVDVVEKVLTGRCGPLESGVQSVSWTRHGPHINALTTEMEVVLTDGQRSVSIKVDTDPATLDRTWQNLLEAARRRSFILRRHMLLGFVAASPVDRYKAVESFLQLDQYSTFEAGLRTLRDEAHETYLRACVTRHERQAHLTRVLGLPGGSGIDRETCLQRVNGYLVAAGVPAATRLEEMPDRLRAVQGLLQGFNDADALQRLERFASSVNSVGSVDSLMAAARELAEAQGLLEREEHKLAGHFYGEVLEKGLAWIEEDDLRECPLCDGPITISEVASLIRRRLAEHETLTSLRADARQKRDALLQNVQRLTERLAAVRHQWGRAAGTEAPASVLSALAILDDVVETLKRSPVARQYETLGGALEGLGLDEILAAGRVAIEAKRQQLPNAARFAQIDAARVGAVAATVDWPDLELALREERRAGTGRTEMETLVGWAEVARKDAVQSLMNRVCDLAGEYYRRIHEGEEIGSPQLEVTRRGTASLALTSEFFGRRGDPRGHLSDGHVDTLGLCLFLAIRRLHYRQEPQLALLVLDDVLHSIDGEHREAIAALLMTEFKDHQLLITTHDILWFERLKKAARRHAPGKKFVARRIARWSLEAGPEWGDHLADYEWLASDAGVRALPADRAARAGRCLEECLKNLCDGLSIAVPFSMRGDYTIDPLWTAFSARARKRASFVSRAGMILDAVDETKAIRNWVGGHWNEWAQSLTGSEAGSFASAVLDLRAVTYCAACERFIRRIDELGGLWSCECEGLRFDE